MNKEFWKLFGKLKAIETLCGLGLLFILIRLHVLGWIGNLLSDHTKAIIADIIINYFWVMVFVSIILLVMMNVLGVKERLKKKEEEEK